MRRCLDCPKLTARGSRCRECAAVHAAARDRVKNARRPGAARKSLPRAAKFRDGYQCQACGSTKRLEAHHIIPIAQGGAHTLDNLVTLCHGCHHGVHNGESVHVRIPMAVV